MIYFFGGGMANTVQMNLNVQVITKARVKQMARESFRRESDMVDLLVAEAWKKLHGEQDPEPAIDGLAVSTEGKTA